MKKRIPILALTTVLCLSLCTGPALAANAVDASGTVSDFESSWQMEALYGTETWTGSAQIFDPYVDYSMDLPVYFVGEDSLMTAVQDNYYDLRVAEEVLWTAFGMDYDAGMEVDMSRAQFYDVEEYGPSAHMQGSVYVLHKGVYTCYRDVAYATPDCIVVAGADTASGATGVPGTDEDAYTVTDDAGNVFTLDKPYVAVSADELSGTPEYELQPGTTVTAPEGIDFYMVLSYSILTGNGGGGEVAEDARRSVTVEEDKIYEFRTDADTCINFRVEPVNPFTDVAEDAYYYAPALWAAKNGVTTGTSATTFSPEQTCTRGEIITLLWRFYGSPEPTSAGSAFADVTDPDSYYYKACQWAAEQGMTDGDTFAPGDPCTRAMAVEFLWHANQRPQVEVDTGFADVPAGASYADAVTWAVDRGVTQGTGEGTFSPNLTCTRGQIVTFLFRSIW